MKRGRAYRRHQQKRARRRAERRLIAYLGDRGLRNRCGVGDDWLSVSRWQPDMDGDTTPWVSGYWRQWLYRRQEDRTHKKDSVRHHDRLFDLLVYAPPRGAARRDAIKEQLETTVYCRVCGNFTVPECGCVDPALDEWWSALDGAWPDMSVDDYFDLLDSVDLIEVEDDDEGAFMYRPWDV